MENQTFQEHEEAAAKLQRVKLSSTQLPTYFVGWQDWLRVRDLVKPDESTRLPRPGFEGRRGSPPRTGAPADRPGFLKRFLKNASLT